MRTSEILARAEAEKQRRLEALYARNAQLAAERDRNRAANWAGRQILGACWLCGSHTDLPEGLTRFQLPQPLGRIDGVLCKPCRAVGGGLAEMVTHRLWTTKLPQQWGWKPIPSRRDRTAVQMGYAINADGAPVDQLTWTVASEWWTYTWAWRVLQVRSEASAKSPKDQDPRPPKKPFGWLT